MELVQTQQVVRVDYKYTSYLLRPSYSVLRETKGNITAERLAIEDPRSASRVTAVSPVKANSLPDKNTQLALGRLLDLIIRSQACKR